MARQLVGVALLTLVMAACSSTPIDTTEQSSTESDLGSVNLPLTTTVKDGTVYHLKAATFTITGVALAAPRVVSPPVDEGVHNEPLPVGAYSILLSKGWVLEKRGPAEKAFTPVTAQLVTPNPLGFTVDGKLPADAFFGFVTSSGDVSLGQGSVNIRIGVADCSAYDTYTAALGALTADCRGTVDPRDYKVNADGFLVPTFDFCQNDPTQGAMMREIRQLLSLQYRSARLPFGKQCMAGRYDAYLQKFAGAGVEVCPTWKKERVVNPITDAVISRAIKMMPPLGKDDGTTPAVLELLKENSIYSVSLDANTKNRCETPAACAQLCAGAFPGFVLAGEGSSVLTDPAAWLSSNTYTPPTPDPYLRAGYFHPMSYYGGAPGVQFGTYARFDPCGGEICPPEACSYFAGIHLKTQLQKDCLDKANIDTCVSYCGNALP